MEKNIVIMAGGISSRMKKALDASKLTEDLKREAAEKPKSMIPVGDSGRPFLDYLLTNVLAAGYSNVCIVVGEKDDSIRRRYEDSHVASLFEGLHFSYAMQPIPPGRSKPLGTADALLRALCANPTWRGGRLTVCNSDNLYSVEALRLLLEDEHPNALVDYDREALRFPQERISKFAVIKKNKEGFVEDIIEKPSPEKIAEAADENGRVGVSMNLFRFSYDLIFPELERVPIDPVRQEKELPSAVRQMIRSNPRSMFAIPVSEHVPDLTSPEDILRVKRELGA